MRRLLALPFIAVLPVLGVLVAPAAPACACTCSSPDETLSERRADVVFEATAIDSSTRERAPVYVRFLVHETRKGVVDERTIVLTGMGDADCGVYFQDGQRYLVFASRQRDGQLRTTSCSANRKLGPGTTATTSAAPPPAPAPARRNVWTPFAAGVGGALVAVFLVRLRRRQVAG